MPLSLAEGGSDLKAKRAVLKKLMAWVELGKDAGNVSAPCVMQTYMQYPGGILYVGPHT